MKRTFSTFLMTFLLSALIGASAVVCFAETFQLDYELPYLLAGCGLGALVAAVSMLPRRRWPILLTETLLFGVVIWWQWPLLHGGWQTVLYRVTSQFSKDFPVKVAGSMAGDPLWFLLAVAAVMVWTIAWVCSGKGGALPAVLVCLPIFVSCLLVVGIAPVLWLVLLTAGLFLLLVTQGVRARNPNQGNRLAWLLLIPTALLISAIVLLSPPEEYVRSEWIRSLQQRAEEGLGIEAPAGAPVITISRWNSQLKRENLRWLGPRTLTGKHVLDYRAETRLSYLRGVSLGVYENNAWSAVSPQTYAAQQFGMSQLVLGSGKAYTLEVRADTAAAQLYTPYYLNLIPDGMKPIDDAYLENTDNVTEYAIGYSIYGRTMGAAYDRYAEEVYTQLPEELREPLEQYLRDNDLVGKSPVVVSAYVQNAAVYDLKTPRVPTGEDFVLYFLNESHRGYCVHFASATVLLLRAQGIPARYVSGYAVSGPAGEWNAVTADQAHAWVEYYQANSGWQVLDPTPAGWQSQTGEEEPAPEEPDETPDASQTPEEEETTPPQPEEAPDVPEQPDTETSDPPQQTPAPDIPLPDILPGDKPGNAPGGDGNSQGAGEQTVTLGQLLRPILGVLRWLLLPLGVVLLLGLRRVVVLRLRYFRLNNGHPNQRLLLCWRWLVRLSKAAGTTPDPALRQLAEKARFSQHTMEELDLTLMEQAAGQAAELLKSHSAVKRLWYRFGTILY